MSAPPAKAAAPPDALGLLAAWPEPAWLVGGSALTVLAANAAALDWLSPAHGAALDGLAADTLLPSLEDMVFWDGARQGHAGSLDSEVEVPHADGLRTVHRRITALPAQPGQPACWLVSLRDLSRERAAERERERALVELRATLEATADGILVTDLEGHIRAFNRRFARLWSLPEQTLIEHDDEQVYGWMALQTTDPARWRQGFEALRRQSLGNAVEPIRLVNGAALECHTQPQWSQGRPIGRVYSYRELNRRRAGAPAEPADLGVDAATQLPHRQGFLARLDGAVGQARAQGSSLCLLCIELDPQLLCPTGDSSRPQAEPMAAIAARLQAEVRGPSLMARLGGLRLGLLVEQAGEALAESLARRWAAQGWAGPTPLVGIATYPDGASCAEELVGHAEQALAMARLQGQSWHVHRQSLQADSQRQWRLEAALREGLAQAPFRLQFQPRVQAGDEPVVQAVEALVRWRDGATGAELLPGQFLPMAVRAGLAATLDDWVIEHALQQACAWRREGATWRLGVNLSAQFLLRGDSAGRLLGVMAHLGWPAEALEVEVNERALLVDPDATLGTLRTLRAAGVQVVLEGFGAGDSAAGLLRQFPITAVKLDRSVLRDASRHRAGRRWLDALVALVRQMGLPCLAVGVESAAQQQLAEAAGCEAWQGFLYAPALDAQRIVQRCGVGQLDPA